MRLLWITIAVGLALASSLFFHRFDPARNWRRIGTAKAASKFPSPDAAATASAPPMSAAHLTTLPRKNSYSRFFPLVASELRLMLKGQRWWWHVVAAGMLVGQLVSPTAEVRSGFLIAAWIWPLLLWSQMGCRESRFATRSLLFSSERSLSRQFPALWIAGVIVALLTGSGAGLRLAIAADLHSFAGWLAGAFFIPSLALALGVWSGGSRAFEAIYTVWWYIGPAHQIPGLDFMGTTPSSSSPLIYTLGACFLIAAAYLRRRRSLGYA
jgi:hypothetical protein